MALSGTQSQYVQGVDDENLRPEKTPFTHGKKYTCGTSLAGSYKSLLARHKDRTQRKTQMEHTSYVTSPWNAAL